MMGGPRKNGVLSETLGVKRSPKKKFPMGVPIRYQVLNGEDLTIGDGLIYFFTE